MAAEAAQPRSLPFTLLASQPVVISWVMLTDRMKENTRYAR
jgi:hypothetical protein